ncbi:class IV adenylate cyclase [Streptomyces sp. CC208A]|uniref:class IV adenylate cyclase n=1 Tax=Streptomyces sp. CC208A TaxID=3044573 RepID=UPI0024A7B3F9|nr:class IV adenylate cyclase [Streptomyces sp. CC208A]
MTEIEVERKRELTMPSGELEKRLRDLGYENAGTSTETDVYYSRPDVDYMATVECLRVRRRGDRTEITYKPPTTRHTHRADDVIAKPETDLVLSGGQALQAEALLTAIGMVELVRVLKHRTTYRLGDVTVTLDEVAGAGVFAETEILSADPDRAARLLDEAEARLGLVACPTVALPYRDLVMRRCRDG